MDPSATDEWVATARAATRRVATAERAASIMLRLGRRFAVGLGCKFLDIEDFLGFAGFFLVTLAQIGSSSVRPSSNNSSPDDSSCSSSDDSACSAFASSSEDESSVLASSSDEESSSVSSHDES